MARPPNKHLYIETNLPQTSPYLDEEESHPQVFIVKSIFNSVLSFLNLANQRECRADDTRVQDTIALIRALPKTRRTQVGNVTRKLTAQQYDKLLSALEALGAQGGLENEVICSALDGLRFDYTRSQKLFEIRLPTSMHGGLEDFIKEKFFRWKSNLEKSNDGNISKAVESIKPKANTNVRFPFPKGPSDTKSPDWYLGHKPCERRCTLPTMVMEFGWSQPKEDIQAKADAYIRRTKGEIRTVVVILMHKMYLAECRNEERLKQMILTGGMHANRSYVYERDERNETGETSILVWRKKTLKNGTVKAECYQDEVFRDQTGNPVESVSLRLPLQDFICQGILEAPAGEFQAPEFEISSTDLCVHVNEDLSEYRQEMVTVVKARADIEEQKRRQEEEVQKAAKEEK